MVQFIDCLHMKMDMFHGYVRLPKGIYVSSSECAGYSYHTPSGPMIANVPGKSRHHDDVMRNVETEALKHVRRY